MITVRVLCEVPRPDGGMIPSCPKVYTFDTLALAEEFVEKTNALPQDPNAGNFIHAVLVQETAYLTQDATPLFLHDIGLSSPEEGKPREIEYHSVSLFTVAEIEDFRNTGQHPAIVYAYDHMDSVEPAILTPDEYVDGGNYYFGDEDWEFFLSFNPNIVSMLKEKYNF